MLINRIVKNNKQIHNVNSVVAVRCPVCHKGRLMDASGYTQPFALHFWHSRWPGFVYEMSQVWPANRHNY